MSSQQNKLKENRRRKKVFFITFSLFTQNFWQLFTAKNIAKYFLIRFRYFICFDQFDEACVLSNLLFLNSFIFCQQLMGGFESTTYNSMTTNVTRFGQILPLHRKKYKSFCQFLRVYLVFGKIPNLLWQILKLLDRFSLLWMDRYWKNNQPIWSQWSQSHLCLYEPRKWTQICST